MEITGKLTSFHKTAIAMLADGKSIEETALILNVAPGEIIKLRRNPLWRAEEGKLKKDKELQFIDKSVNELVPSAITTLEKCVRDAVVINNQGICVDYKTRLAAAKIIIEYARDNLTSAKADAILNPNVPDWMQKYVITQNTKLEELSRL